MKQIDRSTQIIKLKSILSLAATLKTRLVPAWEKLCRLSRNFGHAGMRDVKGKKEDEEKTFHHFLDAKRSQYNLCSLMFIFHFRHSIDRIDDDS